MRAFQPASRAQHDYKNSHVSATSGHNQHTQHNKTRNSYSSATCAPRLGQQRTSNAAWLPHSTFALPGIAAPHASSYSAGSSTEQRRLPGAEPPTNADLSSASQKYSSTVGATQPTHSCSSSSHSHGPGDPAAAAAVAGAAAPLQHCHSTPRVVAATLRVSVSRCVLKRTWRATTGRQAAERQDWSQNHASMQPVAVALGVLQEALCCATTC